MSKKITYLLGAGASANAIPTVADMLKRMKNVILYYNNILNEYVNKTGYREFNIEIYNRLPALEKLCNDFAWLINEAGNHSTIDTLAKQFYLTSDNTSLARLKRSLIAYFTLEQFVPIPSKLNEQNEGNFRELIDKRYGNFIAAITQKRYPIAGGNPDGLAAENLGFWINSNIKILAWNYDIQFELSLKQFSKTILSHIKREFQIFPNETSRNGVPNITIDTSRFAMVKLNGDALWYKASNDTPRKYTIFDGSRSLNKSDDLLIEFLDAYSPICVNEMSQSDEAIMRFNFAWENDNNFRDKYAGHGKNLEMAEKVACETEILVVIGYSFPVFNREIDSILFNRMSKLKKIYIQDKNPERIQSTMINAFKNLRQYINALPEDRPAVEFQLEQYTDQFVIPYELNEMP